MSLSDLNLIFREELYGLVSQFIGKLQSICQNHHVQLADENEDLFNSILGSINPIVEDEPYNPQTLSNFLKETLNNQTEKKLKTRYLNKDITVLSGSTSLFGCFDSYSISNPLKSLANRSIQSQAHPLASRDERSIQNQSTLPKTKEQDHSSYLCAKSSDDSIFRYPNREENKKYYKLYPMNLKLEIIDYALQFGSKQSSEKYHIPVSKINVWTHSLTRQKQTRGRKPIDPDMEDKVCNWLKGQLDRGVILTQKIIRQKAKRISCSYDFKASKGWLQKFFKRRPQLFKSYSQNRKCHFEFPEAEISEQQHKVKKQYQISQQEGELIKRQIIQNQREGFYLEQENSE